MKNRRKKAKFDPLAFAILRTSPEFGRWVCGMGELPSLYSLENINRVLHFHIRLATDGANGLAQAKKALHAEEWPEARRIIKEAFQNLKACATYEEAMLMLLAECRRERRKKKPS